MPPTKPTVITMTRCQNQFMDKIKGSLARTGGNARKLLFEIELTKQERAIMIECVKEFLRRRSDRLKTESYTNQYGLLSLTAFSAVLSEDDNTEDEASVYDLLNHSFEVNLLQQNWRDFIRKVCENNNLVLIQPNINRLYVQTLFLHAGMPSRYFDHFFDRILSRIDNQFVALENLIDDPHLPNPIRRFFNYGADSARQFLADCLEMRDALSRREEVTAEELGVSTALFNAYKHWRSNTSNRGASTPERRCLDESKGCVVYERTGQIVQPQSDEQLLFFRQNNKEKRAVNRLPATFLWCVVHKSVSLLPEYEKCITHSSERLSGVWRDYRYFGLNLSEETKLTFKSDNGLQEFTLLPQLNCELLPEGQVFASGRPVKFIGFKNYASNVYNKLPKIRLTGGNLEQIKRANFYLSAPEDVEKKQPIPLAADLLYETNNGLILDLQQVHEHVIQIPGTYFFKFWIGGAIRGMAEVSLYHNPSLSEIRFDKEFYEANEGGAITGSVNSLFPPSTDLNFIDDYYELQIPIPRKQWRIDNGESTSKPLIIQEISPTPNSNFLKVCLPLVDGAEVRIVTDIEGKNIPVCEKRISNGKLSFDLAILFNHVVNNTAIVRAEYRFAGQNERCELLRIFRKWKPEGLEITQMPNDNKRFAVTFQPDTFLNRRLLLWNTNAPWEQPEIFEIQDGDGSVEITLTQNGQYIVQPDTATPNEWGMAEEITKFAIPVRGITIDIGGDYRQYNTPLKDLINDKNWENLAFLLIYLERRSESVGILGNENIWHSYSSFRDTLITIQEKIQQLSTLDETVNRSSLAAIKRIQTKAEEYQRQEEEHQRRNEAERQRRIEEYLQQLAEEERRRQAEEERSRRARRAEDERRRHVEEVSLTYSFCLIATYRAKSVANFKFDKENVHGTLIFHDREVNFNVTDIISRINPDKYSSPLRTATIKIEDCPALSIETVFMEVVTKPPYPTIGNFKDLFYL